MSKNENLNWGEPERRGRVDLNNHIIKIEDVGKILLYLWLLEIRREDQSRITYSELDNLRLHCLHSQMPDTLLVLYTDDWRERIIAVLENEGIANRITNENVLFVSADQTIASNALHTYSLRFGTEVKWMTECVKKLK